MQQLANRFKEQFPRLDILINNAGAGRWLPLLDTSPGDARAMMAVPYFTAFDLTRAFAPGTVVQTLLAKSAVLIHASGRGGFDVHVPRSYADYAWAWLENAQAEYGGLAS